MDLYHLIDRLESLVEVGTKLPLSSKIIIDEHQLLDIVDHLRVSVPEDVKEAERVLQLQESLLKDAQSEAQRVIQAAEEEAKARVQAHELVRLAEERSQQILREVQERAKALLQEAEERALARCKDADEYTLEVLRRLDAQLSGLLGSVRRGIETLDQGGTQKS